MTFFDATYNITQAQKSKSRETLESPKVLHQYTQGIEAKERKATKDKKN